MERILALFRRSLRLPQPADVVKLFPRFCFYFGYLYINIFFFFVACFYVTLIGLWKMRLAEAKDTSLSNAIWPIAMRCVSPLRRCGNDHHHVDLLHYRRLNLQAVQNYIVFFHKEDQINLGNSMALDILSVIFCTAMQDIQIN